MAARGEEADVFGAGEFLGGLTAGGVGGGRGGGVVVGGGVGAGGGGDGADDVEVIGDEGFVGDQEEEVEFFEDGDLGYAGEGDCLGGGRRWVSEWCWWG